MAAGSYVRHHGVGVVSTTSAGSTRAVINALFTVSDVALLLKVSRRTVLDLIAAGEMRAINIGGTRCHGARWRVTEQDLGRFIEARASCRPR
jgi:excisionase family DNA binding protein